MMPKNRVKYMKQISGSLPASSPSPFFRDLLDTTSAPIAAINMKINPPRYNNLVHPEVKTFRNDIPLRRAHCVNEAVREVEADDAQKQGEVHEADQRHCNHIEIFQGKIVALLSFLLRVAERQRRVEHH